jgi:acetylglutamate synthase
MSDYMTLGVSFTMLIACAIGIDSINKANAANKKNKNVKGARMAAVTKSNKRFLVLLLLIAIAGILFSGFRIAKSKGAVNIAKAKFNQFKAARAAGPAAPVAPGPGPAPAAGTPAAVMQPNPVAPAV